MMPFGPLVWLGVLASLLFSVFFLALVSWASSGEMVEVGKAPGISLSFFVMQDSRFGKARYIQLQTFLYHNSVPVQHATVSILIEGN